MSTSADLIIDGLGGTTAVSRLIKAPLSTVHSWRKKGDIPAARLDHLRLAAKEAGLDMPNGEGGVADHGVDDAQSVADGSPGNPADLSRQVAA